MVCEHLRKEPELQWCMDCEWDEQSECFPSRYFFLFICPRRVRKPRRTQKPWSLSEAENQPADQAYKLRYDLAPFFTAATTIRQPELELVDPNTVDFTDPFSINLPSVPIAAPADWMDTYNDLLHWALVRSNQRIDYTRFMTLPSEVRELIYSHVLCSARLILPHLCDSKPSSTPAFHDDNASDHSAVYKLTALTRVTKKFREECIPVFYAVNTFAVGPDTLTYFSYLQRLGRLDWVHRVQLEIQCGAETRAAWVLRCVEQVDAEGGTHEKNGRWEGEVLGEVTQKIWMGSPSYTPSAGATATTAIDVDADADVDAEKPLTTRHLLRHPHYHTGGFQDLNLALLLRLLSTPSSLRASAPTPTAAAALPPHTRRIVIPLSNTHVFTHDPTLRWFPALLHGLGLDLRCVSHAASAVLHPHCLTVRWERRFQGQDVDSFAVADEEGVLGRAREMFPSMEEMRRPEKSCYYRVACGGRRASGVVWFDMPTLGGARA